MKIQIQLYTYKTIPGWGLSSTDTPLGCEMGIKKVLKSSIELVETWGLGDQVLGPMWGGGVGEILGTEWGLGDQVLGPMWGGGVGEILGTEWVVLTLDRNLRECFFWRTSGCSKPESCIFKHVQEHKHIDRDKLRHWTLSLLLYFMLIYYCIKNTNNMSSILRLCSQASFKGC